MGGWLVDNNVPRSVTHLLRDRGQDAVEVRAVLGQEAPDDVVAAYAVSQGMYLITHDRGCARIADRLSLPHVWLRTAEPRDADRLREVLDPVLMALGAGVIRVIVFQTVLRVSALL